MRTIRRILYLVAIILMIVYVVNLFSCKSEASSVPQSKSKPDTSQIIGVFVDLKGESIQHNIMYRVITDTLKIDTSNILRNIIRRDSFYFAPWVDSARNPQTAKPLFDSLGKAMFTTYWLPIPKEKVWDSGIRVDSAKSRFKKYLKNSTIVK